MSDSTVFVDDAVQGHLPMVCVRTGAPAVGLHRIHTSIGGTSGWAFLLIFLGPIGWLALLVVMALGRSRDLLVRLPYSQRGLDDERRELRAAVTAGAVMVTAGVALALVAAGLGGGGQVGRVLALALLGATVVAGLVTFVLAVVYASHRPGVELDASGRWVTLRGVHPDFVVEVARRAPQRTARD